MKKWFFLGAISALILASCAKDDTTSTACTATTPTTVAPDSQKVYLQNYLAANNINAVEKNGMFYVINTQGTGSTPTACSFITASFTGKFIKGTVDGIQFDSAPSWQPFQTQLSSSNLIEAWKIIIPLLKKGGTLTMYVPPFFAYGVTDNTGGSVTIPANSYLKFQVSLLGFQ
jgi:FKBP-type peptidyl-prolyl cis-trans isomerase FkpA